MSYYERIPKNRVGTRHTEGLSASDSTDHADELFKIEQDLLLRIAMQHRFVNTFLDPPITGPPGLLIIL